MKIVLTGSLGNISKPLAITLLQKGHSVIVISKSPEKQKDIENLGAMAAIGSVDDVDFLAKTFDGADLVYCMIPPNFKEADQIAYYKRVGSNYAKAIGQAGVKRVIHLSSYGAHLEKGTGFITGSYEVEKIFNALPGIRVTHIRPGYFYYNLFNFIGMIKATGFIASNYGGNDKLGLVSPLDIAAAIAEEIALPGATNKVCYVISDDRSCNEIASVLGNAIGQPGLQWNLLTDEQALTSLQASGIPASTAATLVELGVATHSGILREDYDRQQPTQGKIKLETFAKEFAAAYHDEANRRPAH
ncbi:MAG: NmrA family NAD(P)-binding protein [Chitinophagaceae bacterium]